MTESTSTDVPHATDSLTLAAYKELVRAEAIALLEAHSDWNRTDAANAFDRLGLEPPPVKRTFKFHLDAKAVVELGFQATSLEDATKQLEDWLRINDVTNPRMARDIVKYNACRAEIGAATEFRDEMVRAWETIPAPVDVPIDVNV